MPKIHLNQFWPLMYSIIKEYWAITEPYIERAADENDIPIELYYYGELCMPYFSVENFQKRDPFTNPERFEKNFARLEFKDWIFPSPTDDGYQVSRKAQDAIRRIVSAGDHQLSGFTLVTNTELNQTAGLLKKILKANFDAPEPPEKWAILKRFRTISDNAPLIAQLREALMYMFAFRDDANLSAARPHFGNAGIVWSVLGYVWKQEALNAAQMAGRMSFRGYDEFDYKVAIQAAEEIGWVEPGDTPDTYRPTSKGKEVREMVERQTDEYFYRPWKFMSEHELVQLLGLLKKLQEQLILYRNSSTLLIR